MFLSLTDTLVATFNERPALTSRKYVAEQAILTLNWSKSFQPFWSHFFLFSLEKQAKNLNFQSVLPVTDPLVGSLNEMRTPTSKKYVAEQGIMMPNREKTFQTWWSHSSLFAFVKQVKSLTFQKVFTSNRPLGAYFLWKISTYFQKICSWTRYSDAEFIKNNSNF